MALTIYNSDSYNVLDLPDGYRGIKNDFFKRFLTFYGIPIMAPGVVDDFAIKEARYLCERMFEKCEHRIATMHRSNLIICLFPDTKQAGLFDPRMERINYIVCDEVNLLQGNRSTLIHELAHALHHTLAPYEKNHIETLFGTHVFYPSSAYATKNVFEYFAEGVSAYFGAGTPGEALTKRSHLKFYDTQLYNYIDAIFEANPFQWKPVGERLYNLHLLGYKP